MSLKHGNWKSHSVKLGIFVVYLSNTPSRWSLPKGQINDVFSGHILASSPFSFTKRCLDRKYTYTFFSKCPSDLWIRTWHNHTSYVHVVWEYGIRIGPCSSLSRHRAIDEWVDGRAMTRQWDGGGTTKRWYDSDDVMVR